MILTPALWTQNLWPPAIEDFGVARGPAGADQKSVSGAGIELWSHQNQNPRRTLERSNVVLGRLQWIFVRLIVGILQRQTGIY